MVGSWNYLDLSCKLEGVGTRYASSKCWVLTLKPLYFSIYFFFLNLQLAHFRLAVFETRRENDCVTKYILDKYEDQTSKMFAIGLKTEPAYPGIYEWSRVNPDTIHPDAATLTFQNWVPSKSFTSIECQNFSLLQPDPWGEDALLCWLD